MIGGRAVEDGGESTGELRDVGAAVVPERRAIRWLGKAEHFLHSTIAVGGDDENAAGQLGRGLLRQAQNNIVMKFALDPVRDEVQVSLRNALVNIGFAVIEPATDSFDETRAATNPSRETWSTTCHM